MLSIPIIGPSIQEALEQLKRAVKEADLIELRLDLFHSTEEREIRTLQVHCPLPMIFTLRSASQGGKYPHSEDRRLQEIEALAALNPAYFDLESDLPVEYIDRIKKRFPQMKLIISYHNFEEREADLPAIYQKMTRSNLGSLYKIAIQTKNTMEALRLLHFRKRVNGPLIAMGMGKGGALTRILGPIMGNAITYASLEESLQTAPGQVEAQILRDLYQFRQLNGSTSIFALIGSPLKSFGHLVHNGVIKKRGLNAVYVKIEVEVGELPEFFMLVKALQFKGLSVTMPLKEAILPFIDKLTKEAKEIGAANTLYFNEEVVYGYNTDGVGAVCAIEKISPLSGKMVCIFGAGGTAKAIAHAAYQKGGEILVVNRNERRAKELANQYKGVGMTFLECETTQFLARSPKAQDAFIINTLPVSPPIDFAQISPHAVLMDVGIAEFPLLPSFLQMGQKKGVRIVTGFDMWIEQAIQQARIFYKNESPL